MGDRDWYYKASFDKANRTSLKGKRGAGQEGQEMQVFDAMPQTDNRA